MFRNWWLLTVRLFQFVWTVVIFAFLLVMAAFGGLILNIIATPLIGAFVGWVLGLTPLGPFVAHGAQALGLNITVADLPALFAFIGMVAAFFKPQQAAKS